MKKLIFILCLLPIMALGQYTFTDAGTSITISGEGQRFAFEKAGLAIFKYPPNIILSSQGHAYKWHWETIDSPSYSTIDSLFTELQSWLLSAIVVEYYWDPSGDTISTNYHVQIDSTAIFNSFTAVDGTFSGTITDGTTSIAGGDITGTNTIEAVKVDADTLTDGVGTLTAGALSGITTIDATGDITVTGADISGDSARFSHYGGHSPFDIGTDDSTLISFTGTGIEISGDITLEGNIIGGSVTLCDSFLYESGFDTVLYDDFAATYAFVICDTTLIEQLCEEYIDPDNEYSVILPEIYVYGLTDTVHLTSNDANITGYDYGEGVYLDCEEEICFVLYIDQGDFNEGLDYFGFMIPALEATPTIIPYITGVNTITFADETEQTTAWTGELPSDITGVNTITFADETEQSTAWTGELPSDITGVNTITFADETEQSTAWTGTITADTVDFNLIRGGVYTGDSSLSENIGNYQNDPYWGWSLDTPPNYDGLAYFVDINKNFGYAVAKYQGRIWRASVDSSIWVETRPKGDVDADWYSISYSTDGTYLMVGELYGRMYQYNTTWGEIQPAGNVDKNWYTIEQDYNGHTIICGETYGRLYLSTDIGNNFNEVQPAGDYSKYWHSAAISATGDTILVGAYADRLYVSVNSGSSWTEVRPEGDLSYNWNSVDMTKDGTVMYAVCSSELNENGRFYYSENAGSTWAEFQPTGEDEDYDYKGVSASQDGTSIVVCFDEEVWLSNDSGNTWEEQIVKEGSLGLWSIALEKNINYENSLIIQGGDEDGIYKYSEVDDYVFRGLSFSDETIRINHNLNIENEYSSFESSEFQVDGDVTIYGKMAANDSICGLGFHFTTFQDTTIIVMGSDTLRLMPARTP